MRNRRKKDKREKEGKERERRAKNDGQLMSRRWAGELRRAKSGNDALLYFSSHPPSALAILLFPAHLFFYLRLSIRDSDPRISAFSSRVNSSRLRVFCLREREDRTTRTPIHRRISLTSPLRLSRKLRLLRDDSCRETGQHARVRSDVFHLE